MPSRRRVPILAKLLLAYLVPTVATLAGFGLLSHYVARRALEEELGRRLTGVAAAVASQLDPELLESLQPGDESTRTFRNVRRRLDELQRAGGVAGVVVFTKDGTAVCDTRDDVHIGDKLFRLEADRSELRQVFAGKPAASVLFRGKDGALYKTGYAPLLLAGQTEPPTWAVGVDGEAALYAQLAGFRRTLLGLAAGGALLVIALSVLVARLLTQPVRRLERAAQRIGDGDLGTPVDVASRDEVGRVAETLEDMRRQLLARDERMQMMLAGIAHEVRNPLGGMELYVGLLRDELASMPNSAEALGQLERVARELGHLGTIVREFLDYARRPRPELLPRDAASLVAEVGELLRKSAAERRVEVSTEVAPAEVRCDAGQLRRALLNLGMNAVQACPTDGTGRVRLGCATSDGQVCLTVADSGPGIPADALDKIWTPFFTTKQAGTGLGLAFVRDIAKDHGARVEVASAAGAGTTFTLVLPAAAGAES